MTDNVTTLATSKSEGEIYKKIDRCRILYNQFCALVSDARTRKIEIPWLLHSERCFQASYDQLDADAMQRAVDVLPSDIENCRIAGEQAERDRRMAPIRAEAAPWIQRGADAILGEIERLGLVRLANNGDLIYDGNHLSPGLLLALEKHGAEVRSILAGRWRNRVILPAPEPSAPATQAAA